MKGLSKWIISVIEEVNDEIRENLAMRCLESDESKAFCKILEEIEAKYSNEPIKRNKRKRNEKNLSPRFIRIINFKYTKN